MGGANFTSFTFPVGMAERVARALTVYLLFSFILNKIQLFLGHHLVFLNTSINSTY